MGIDKSCEKIVTHVNTRSPTIVKGWMFVDRVREDNMHMKHPLNNVSLISYH